MNTNGLNSYNNAEAQYAELNSKLNKSYYEAQRDLENKLMQVRVDNLNKLLELQNANLLSSKNLSIFFSLLLIKIGLIVTPNFISFSFK
jgi:hypothetical protein